MQFTPSDIDIEKINNRITEINHVKNLHHVHVWQLDDKMKLFEAHIDLDTNLTLTDFQFILDKIEKILHEYGIYHVNIQPEYDRDDDKKIIVQHTGK